MAIHLLGIRHHGPGSCRNVLNYLQELQPDLILVEGPAEAEALLACVGNPQMVPPVALLAYQPDEPQRAVFYPFAEFSPEWQAMRYAVQNGVPLRFFDLPLVYSMALRKQEELKASEELTESEISEMEATEEEKAVCRFLAKHNPENRVIEVGMLGKTSILLHGAADVETFITLIRDQSRTAFHSGQ